MNGVQIEYGQYVYILKYKYSTKWHGQSIQRKLSTVMCMLNNPQLHAKWFGVHFMHNENDVFLTGSWIQRILGFRRYTFKKKTTWHRNAENYSLCYFRWT